MGNNFFNNNQNQNSETERDEKLARYLEQLPPFSARPQFQTDLKTRILTQAVEMQKTPARRQSFFTSRRLAMVAVAIVLAVAALVVTIVITRDTPEAQVFSQVYDPETQSYLSPQQAQQNLGFSLYLPKLPSDYKVESAALGSDIFQEPNNSANPSNERTLQVSLEPKNGAQATPIEIYEVHIPQGFDILQRIQSVQGAQSYGNVEIQGQRGYFIRGTNWRMTFLGAMLRRRNPGGVGNRPTAPGNTQMVRQVPFGFGRVPQSDPRNPQFFLQFLPLQRWTNGATTLMWEKNGILTVIVTNPNTNQNQVQQLADSFHELNINK